MRRGGDGDGGRGNGDKGPSGLLNRELAFIECLPSKDFPLAWTTTIGIRYYYFLVTGEELDAEKGQVICPNHS